MSARDSAGPAGPGTKGAGGLANGGVGGGFGGGAYGGGGGYGAGGGINGGYSNRTGLTTGTRMYGGMATGRPGGMAQNPGAWGMRPSAAVQQGPLNRPTHPALLGNPIPASVPGVNPVAEYAPPVTPYVDPMAMYALPPIPQGYPQSPNIHMSPNPTQRPYDPATSPPISQAPIPPSGLMYGNGSMWPGQNTYQDGAYNPGPTGYNINHAGIRGVGSGGGGGRGGGW